MRLLVAGVPSQDPRCRPPGLRSAWLPGGHHRNLGAEAGLTSGAIYHYFGSKLDLYLAVHDDAQDRVYSRFTEAIGRADTFRGQNEAVLEAAHDMNAEDPTLAQFLGSLRVDTRRDPELRKAFTKSASYRADFFASIVDVGIATGEIGVDHQICGYAPRIANERRRRRAVGHLTIRG